MTFRLLTYNILNGGVGRTESLAKVINGCAPDLVLLQEAWNDTGQRLRDRFVAAWEKAHKFDSTNPAR